MIEPHSAQLGASSWILKATFALPSESVTVPDPFPFEALAGAAWPLVAMTARSLPRAPAAGAGAAATAGAVSTAIDARGSSVGGVAGSAFAGAGAGSAATAGATSADADAVGEPNPNAAAPLPNDGASEPARSWRPSIALSSAPRNRDPSHRKM